MVSGDVGPPALGALADGDSQPSVVDPSSEGEDVKCEPAAPVLPLEQQGAATSAGFKEHARGKKWLAEGRRTGAMRQRKRRAGADRPRCWVRSV